MCGLTENVSFSCVSKLLVEEVRVIPGSVADEGVFINFRVTVKLELEVLIIGGKER